MSLERHEINASDIEPMLRIGNFVKLNSGSPTLMVVDQDGAAATFAWADRSGKVSEIRLPIACVHRVLIA